MFTHYSRTRRTVEYATFPFSQCIPTFSQPVLWLSQVFTYSAEAWKRPCVSEHPAPGLLLGEFSFTHGMRCFCLREEPHTALEHLGTAPGKAQQGPPVPALPADAGGCSGLWSRVCTGKTGCFWRAVTISAKWSRRDLPTEANCRGQLLFLQRIPLSPLPIKYSETVEMSACS